MPKKKVSHIVQHEWIAVRAWFNDFTVKVNLTVSYSGNTVRISGPGLRHVPDGTGKPFMTVLKHLRDSKQFANLGEMMQKVAAIAEQQTTWDGYYKALYALT